MTRGGQFGDHNMQFNYFLDRLAVPVEQTDGVLLPAPPAFHAVPPYVGGAEFVGRAGHLARLDEWGASNAPVMVVEAIGGTGKSALTWTWAAEHASRCVRGLAGRLWWSFYEGSASMTRFLQEALAYLTRQPVDAVRQLPPAQLSGQVVAKLRTAPYLLVLDGFERMLGAYHRFDPARLLDDEVETGMRSVLDPNAEDLLRLLSAAGPSKVLLSTRLMPDALERFGQPLPGVWHLRLPGLSDDDTARLAGRLGLRGDAARMTGFFRTVGNHPLLVGVVAGLVRDYRPGPGDLDAWLADPAAGAGLAYGALDLVQRRHHILAAALDGLPPDAARLLDWISVLPGPVDWPTLEAVNPFRSVPLAHTYAAGTHNIVWGAAASVATPNVFEWDPSPLGWRHELLTSLPKTFSSVSADQLRAALSELEGRGLLWWNRAPGANSYDLHPIIRAHVYDRLDPARRIEANNAVRDHFAALPPENPALATSVEDLHRTITVFRALVGAGRTREASTAWESDLSDALSVDIGAYATVVELLGPLAVNGSSLVRGNLTLAYYFLGRYEEAIRNETGVLAAAIAGGAPELVLGNLLRIDWALYWAGSDLAFARCGELEADLLRALGRDPEHDAALCLRRATLAAYQGRTADARTLLARAEQLQPSQWSRWHRGNVEVLRLRLAAAEGVAVTAEELDSAQMTSHTWRHRYDLVQLRAALLVRDGRLAEALTVARQEETLARNAGLEAAPALSALVLAQLDRRDEASAAVELALSRLTRIHPAHRPHLALAQALRLLDREAEAAEHALAAYRTAWREGPPNCRLWDLRAAEEVLATLGISSPDLPVAVPATAVVPLEAEIRAYIATLEPRRDAGPQA